MQINCPICHTSEHTELKADKYYTVSRCNNCYALYTSKRPDIEPEELYQKDYYFNSEKKNLDNIHRNKILRSHLLKRLNRLNINASEASLLEIGSEKGHFLNLCKSHFQSINGVEISSDSVKAAKEKYDIEIENTSVEDIDTSSLANQKFDVIVMWEVLEHLHDPLPVIEQLKKLLSQGGVLLLSTPNSDSIYRKIFGTNWGGGIFDIPQYHIVLWNSKTVKKIFDETASCHSEVLQNKKALGIISSTLIRNILKIRVRYLTAILIRLANILFVLPLIVVKKLGHSESKGLTLFIEFQA